MAEQLLQRLVGAVKDRAAVGRARLLCINNARVPALEVAIIRATSHNEFVLVKDKHVQEIVRIVSFSKSYSSICVAYLARRLKKTRNWVVAIKVLLLIHKLLLQDAVDSSFEDELLLASRRMLSITAFRDASRHPLSDQCSRLIRSYALYVGERLDCFVLSGDNFVLKKQGPKIIDFNDHMTDYSSFRQDEDDGRSSSFELVSSSSPKVSMLLSRVPLLQHLLEHVLGCSGGLSIPHALARSVLTLVIRDSFRTYLDVCNGTSVLLNDFFTMVHHDGLKVLAIYGLLARQAEALEEFYQRCRDCGHFTATEYPTVQQVSSELLHLLEDHLKDARKNEVAAVQDLQVQESKLKPDPQQQDLLKQDAGIVKQDVEKVKQDAETVKKNAETVQKDAETVQKDAEAVKEDAEAVKQNAEKLKQAPSTSRDEACGSSSSGAAEEWELELMKEASKLTYSLSQRRSTSFSSSPKQSGRNSRRYKMLSMPARLPAATSALKNDRVGLGSGRSYGKLMSNKQPRGHSSRLSVQY